MDSDSTPSPTMRVFRTCQSFETLVQQFYEDLRQRYPDPELEHEVEEAVAHLANATNRASDLLDMAKEYE